MGVRLDHFGEVVRGACKWEFKLRSESTGFLDTVESLFVAAIADELGHKAAYMVLERTKQSLGSSHPRGRLCETLDMKERGILSRRVLGRVVWFS